MAFQVGTAKVDITPNYGAPTRRWHRRGADARITDIQWPLYARTVALADGDTLTTVTSMDVCVLHKVHLDAIRERVRQMSPRPIRHVILHATHQHSDSFIEYEPAYDRFGLNDLAFDLDHVRNFPGRVATSICLAVQALEPATVGYAVGAVEEGIASCRRWADAAGTLRWRSSRPPAEVRAMPRGHIDPAVGVLAFYGVDGAPRATLYNYACHPSAAGGDSPPVCCADYPGFASDLIERQVGGTALFLHGCSGDINPGKYVRGDATASADRLADARRMGRILASETLKTLAGIEPGGVRHWRVASRDALLPVQSGTGDVEAALSRAQAALADWQSKGSDPRTALRKYVLAHKIVDDHCPTTFFALAVNRLAVAFVPGEPFTALGEQIKQSRPDAPTLVAATCGEDPYYMPTPEAVAQGGYETGYVATPQTGASLVRQARALLQEVGEGAT